MALGLISYSAYLPAKAWLSERLIAHSWEVTQNTNKPSPPWPWADTTAIAKMNVPRLHKSLVLLKGTDPTTLAFSAGVMHQYSRLTTTSPFVVAGHRDTHFSFLEGLQMKDVISISDIDGKTQHYKVEELSIVDSEKTPLIIQEDDTRLVLITCYPFNALRAGGSLRYVVKAKIIDA